MDTTERQGFIDVAEKHITAIAETVGVISEVMASIRRVRHAFDPEDAFYGQLIEAEEKCAVGQHWLRSSRSAAQRYDEEARADCNRYTLAALSERITEDCGLASRSCQAADRIYRDVVEQANAAQKQA